MMIKNWNRNIVRESYSGIWTRKFVYLVRWHAQLMFALAGHCLPYQKRRANKDQLGRHQLTTPSSKVNKFFLFIFCYTIFWRDTIRIHNTKSHDQNFGVVEYPKHMEGKTWLCDTPTIKMVCTRISTRPKFWFLLHWKSGENPTFFILGWTWVRNSNK